jgi:hypothetical protein
MVDFRGAVDLSRSAHLRSDVDGGIKSLHHTLGGLPFQAAPGNHGHRVFSKKPALLWRRNTVATPLPAGVWTRLELQTQIGTFDYSEWGTWNAALNQVTIKKSGLFLICANFAYVSTGVSTVYGRIRRVGAASPVGDISPLGRVNESIFAGAVSPELSQTIMLDAVVGQAFALDGFFNIAGNTYTDTTTDEFIGCSLQILRLSDL